VRWGASSFLFFGALAFLVMEKIKMCLLCGGLKILEGWLF